MTPLHAYLTRFLEGALEKTLEVPVLVLEPRPPKEGGEHQFRTESGVGTPAPGEAGTFVLEIRKQKNNAFQRGITLGRTANNDLVVVDGSISRFHAWFHQDRRSGAWSVADAGSKNGTRVRGVKLEPKKPAALVGGERLRFGKVDAKFLTPPQLVALIKARMSS